MTALDNFHCLTLCFISTLYVLYLCSLQVVRSCQQAANALPLLYHNVPLCQLASNVSYCNLRLNAYCTCQAKLNVLLTQRGHDVTWWEAVTCLPRAIQRLRKRRACALIVQSVNKQILTAFFNTVFSIVLLQTHTKKYFKSWLFCKMFLLPFIHIKKVYI